MIKVLFYIYLILSYSASLIFLGYYREKHEMTSIEEKRFIMATILAPIGVPAGYLILLGRKMADEELGSAKCKLTFGFCK